MVREMVVCLHCNEVEFWDALQRFKDDLQMNDSECLSADSTTPYPHYGKVAMYHRQQNKCYPHSPISKLHSIWP